MKQKYINKDRHNKQVYQDLQMLMIEVELLLDIAVNERYDEAVDHFNSNVTFSGDYIDKKILPDIVGNKELADEMIMDIIIPLIVETYNDRVTKGPKGNGIDNFFKNLGYEDNKYDLMNIKTEYGITKGSVGNYKRDLFSERGKPTIQGRYMWRKRPK